MKTDIITIESEKDQKTSVLRTIAQDVTFPLSKDDHDIIQAMKDKLQTLEGVGLAAPQIGISKRITVIYIPESAALLRDNAKSYPMHVLINPRYEGINHEDLCADFEACYSVESVMGKVKRFHHIKLTYQNTEGHIIQTTEEGFYARVLQHEIDHLDGLLITDRLTKDCMQGNKIEMFKARRAALSPEKRKLFDDLMRTKGIVIPEDKS